MSDGILVVDQEAYRSQSLVRGLVTVGYRVFEAGTRTRAVELVTRAGMAIQLIITDCSTRILHHPQMIKAVLERLPDVQVLMMLDHPERYGEAPASWSWPTHFIEKPFMVEELAHLIETLLARM